MARRLSKDRIYEDLQHKYFFYVRTIIFSDENPVCYLIHIYKQGLPNNKLKCINICKISSSKNMLSTLNIYKEYKISDIKYRGKVGNSFIYNSEDLTITLIESTKNVIEIDCTNKGKFKKPLIYLAGPINKGENNWRTKYFSDGQFNVVDPSSYFYEDPYKLVETDLSYIEKCDIIFAYCPVYSPGTSMELVYASVYKKPIVLIVPKSNKSPWYDVHSTYQFSQFRQGLSKLKSLIKDYNEGKFNEKEY